MACTASLPYTDWPCLNLALPYRCKNYTNTQKYLCNYRVAQQKLHKFKSSYQCNRSKDLRYGKKVQLFAGPPCKIIMIKWADAVTCEAWNGSTCRSVTNHLKISEKLSAYNDVLAAFYYDSH